MARSHGGQRSRSGAVHNKEWTVACVDSSTLDLAIGSILAFVMFTADEAETVLRTHGFVAAELNAGGVSERATIAVGLAIISARSASVGATAVPRPATDGSYPWLWHGWLFITSGAEAAIVNENLLDRRDIDSKAMRKVKEDEVMVLVLEVCESVDQAGEARVDAGLRVLTGD